jgi:hypothetical protein
MILATRLGISQLKTSQATSNIATLEQKVTYRQDDLEKLARINSIVEPHSFGGWTQLLGFSSKGGTVPFIQRMEQAGMLMAEKLSEGTRLQLTDKAQTILDAEFFNE